MTVIEATTSFVLSLNNLNKRDNNIVDDLYAELGIYEKTKVEVKYWDTKHHMSYLYY